jgi:CheY-like chemotaxis protein
MVNSGDHRGDPASTRQLGIATYLAKPVCRAELLAAVVAALSNGQSATPPAGSALPSALPETRSPIRAPGRSLHILLAEDNAVNERVACAVLRKWGHTVEVARNGQQAVLMHAAGVFDAILMDVQMPGMDGFEATAGIREAEKRTGAHIHVIAMTAHAMAGYQERCLQAGMDGYVTKPIRPELLLQALAKCAGEPAQEALACDVADR